MDLDLAASVGGRPSGGAVSGTRPRCVAAPGGPVPQWKHEPMERSLSNG